MTWTRRQIILMVAIGVMAAMLVVYDNRVFIHSGGSFPSRNLVKLWSSIIKYRKLWSHVKFANFVYFCITHRKVQIIRFLSTWVGDIFCRIPETDFKLRIKAWYVRLRKNIHITNWWNSKFKPIHNTKYWSFEMDSPWCKSN